MGDHPESEQNVDWGAEATDSPTDEPRDTPPAQQPQKPPQEQPPAQQPPRQDPPPQQQPQRESQTPPPGDQQQVPSGQQTQQQQPPADQTQQQQQKPPAQTGETPEQKAERERREAEEEKKRHQELVSYYKLPDDLAARLATEPEVVLPELAAKLHMAVLNGTQAWATQALPQMFHQHMETVRANDEAKREFYGRWPQLAGKEKQVMEIGRMWRQMNPNATPQEALEAVGTMTCAALGIPTTAGTQQQQQQRPPQQQRPAQQAFRPAATGSSQAGAAPPADNPWAIEAEAILEEDRQA